MDAQVEKPKKRFKLKMPGAFVILFILTIVAVAATWMVPAGSYSKLSYTNSSLQVTDPHGKVTTVPSTQKELDKLGVKLILNSLRMAALPRRYQFQIRIRD